MERIVIRMIIAMAAITAAMISGWVEDPRGVVVAIIVLSSLTIIKQREVYMRAWAMDSWRTIFTGFSMSTLIATMTAIASSGLGFLLGNLVF